MVNAIILSKNYLFLFNFWFFYIRGFRFSNFLCFTSFFIMFPNYNKFKCVCGINFSHRKTNNVVTQLFCYPISNSYSS